MLLSVARVQQFVMVFNKRQHSLITQLHGPRISSRNQCLRGIVQTWATVPSFSKKTTQPFRLSGRLAHYISVTEMPLRNNVYALDPVVRALVYTVYVKLDHIREKFAQLKV